MKSPAQTRAKSENPGQPARKRGRHNSCAPDTANGRNTICSTILKHIIPLGKSRQPDEVVDFNFNENESVSNMVKQICRDCPNITADLDTFLYHMKQTFLQVKQP